MFVGHGKISLGTGKIRIVDGRYLAGRSLLILVVLIKLWFHLEIFDSNNQLWFLWTLGLDASRLHCTYLFYLALCFLLFLQRVQRGILQSDVQSKADRTPVTVADYGTGQHLILFLFF